MSATPQPGILEDVPAASRYLTFSLAPDARPDDVRSALAHLAVDQERVFGIGLPVVALLGGIVPRLRVAPHVVGPGVQMPSTPGALWVWIRGTDRGDLLHRGRITEADLSGAFVLDDVVEGFRYRDSRDLTGYIDGTENPTGSEAVDAAVESGSGPGLDGSAYVAVQTWLHDLDAFASFAPQTRDHVFGRSIETNEELEDAPESAHVKRTAQEDFTPEAWVVRRSMPWSDGASEGLVFVAFAASFDPFEALCRRMVGLDDGIVDGLFKFTRPIDGAYYWCPPVVDGRLDLRALAAD